MRSEPIVRLTAERDRLAAAVFAVLTENDERAARLRRGAEQSMSDAPTEVVTMRRFQTLLELGYLVASADGFADAERASLARLLENVAGSAVDHQVLEQHFRDLDVGVATLGRRERLARAAADVDGEAVAEEAVTLVALITLADGFIAPEEMTALVDLGEHLSLSEGRIHELVEDGAKRVRERLR